MRLLRADGQRALSARLFGHRHKMELLSALVEAPDGRVNLTQLANDRGVQPAVYYPPVKDLIAAHMVMQAPPVPKDRRRWYERTGGDQVWEAVAAFLRSITELSEASVGDAPARNS